MSDAPPEKTEDSGLKPQGIPLHKATYKGIARENGRLEEKVRELEEDMAALRKTLHLQRQEAGRSKRRLVFAWLMFAAMSLLTFALVAMLHILLNG